MNPAINKFDQQELSGRDARLLQEWKELDNVCCKRRASSPDIRKPSLSYIIRRKNATGLPTEYEIWYRVKSIVGVEETEPPRKPIFGYLHKMSVVLPNNYPSADGNPVFTFITDIWHPNIRYSCVSDHQGDGRTGIHQRPRAESGAVSEVPDVSCPKHLPLSRRPECGRMGARGRRA